MGRAKGLTLIELVIFMVTIGVIAAAIVFIIKPSTTLAKSRDTQRYDDLKNLQAAVNLYLASGRDFEGLNGPYSSIYIELSDVNLRKNTDGTGWLPLNFSNTSGVPFEVLPLDPLNTVAHHYRFGVLASAKTYEVEAVFETPENASLSLTDGGNNAKAYELGTDLTIL